MGERAYSRLLQKFPPEAEPFKEGLQQKRLLIMQCGDCGAFRLPHGIACPQCGGMAYRWKKVTGAGEVDSFVIFHRAFHPGAGPTPPYVVARIRLKENIFFLANIVGLAPDMVYCGQKVTLHWEANGECGYLPQFRPAAAQ